MSAYRGGLLPLVDCHALPFLQHLSEAFGKDFRRFADYLTAEHVAHRILDYFTFFFSVVTGKLAVILKTQQNRHLVTPGSRNQVVQPTKIDGRQFIYNHRTFKLPFLVYQLHDTGIVQSQCRRIDVLTVGVVADNQYFRLFRVVYIQREIIARHYPIQCRAYHP